MQVQSLGQEEPLEKERQPTPVFLPGKPHGQRGLVGYSPWGYKGVLQDLATKQQKQSPLLQAQVEHVSTLLSLWLVRTKCCGYHLGTCMLVIYDLWKVTGELTDEPAPRHPMSSALPYKSGGDASRDHSPQYAWVSRPAQSEVFCTMPYIFLYEDCHLPSPRRGLFYLLLVLAPKENLVRYMFELEDLGSPGETVRQGSQAADSMGREPPISLLETAVGADSSPSDGQYTRP